MLRKIGLHHHRASDDGNPAPGLGLEGELSLESATSVDDRAVRSKSSAGSPTYTFQRPGRGQSHRKSEGDLLRSPSNSNSIFSIAESASRTGSQDSDALGLHLVYDSPSPNGDIIFVHGLGGTAKRTWSWERNLEYFWPTWLADEDELSSWRIFTFGYNSNFKGAGTNLNIIDFAKDLLFRMLVFSSNGDRKKSIPIGHQPTIFVAHSMGGLVVKKAYVLGKHDSQYSDIISRTQGIVFLATPHRGAHYAKMLNNILSTTPFGTSSKAYVEDLDIHSRMLQDINEQFRTQCGELPLVSFFETMKTNLGLKQAMIVEKESSVLGYAHEISTPLNADHHSICKFKSREDANYINVKNVLKLLASRLAPLYPPRPPSHVRRSSSNVNVIKQIEAICGVRERVQDEVQSVRSKAMSGTCHWMTYRSNFINWVSNIEPLHGPRFFWLSGPPAMGKTVIASYVVDWLTSSGICKSCQCHFFSSGHQNKRTVAYSLRSIASQLAYVNEEFREQLLALQEETGVSFSLQDQNFSTIWEKIFEGIVFKLKTATLYWVFDAVDEADLPPMLINSLMKIQSSTPIRIFITSRQMRMPSGWATLSATIDTCFLSEHDTIDDIRAYVRNAVQETLPDDEPQIKDDIIEQVLAKAGGSFLWVRLALETLHDNWHTKDDIREVLTEMPRGMEHLYTRMLGKIESQAYRSQLIAKRILSWATCCWRPLSIAELQTALEPEFTGFVRLQETIIQICGNFISVDTGKVSLIHTTAREFLLQTRGGAPAFIHAGLCHEHIATVCLKYLSDEKWKRVFKDVQNSNVTATGRLARTNRLLVAEQGHTLLGYAVCYYAYHVSQSPIESEQLTALLTNFFTKYSLSWIEAIALSKNLRYLTRSARYLKIYAKRRSRRPSLKIGSSPLTLRDPSCDDSTNVHSWAIDFIRIVGKFGPNLMQSPSSVYRLVPPFCPRTSMIGTNFGLQEGAISVTGLPSERWDDCLASVSVGGEEAASKILATNAYFLALISSSGTIVIWYAETCEEARRMEHREYVALMEINKPQTLLVTAGIDSYKVWDIASGRELYKLRKLSLALNKAIAFGSKDSELVVALDDCSATCYDLETSSNRWHFSVPDDGEYYGCPLIVTISPDLTKLAMAWRGKPPVVWSIPGTISQRPLRCRVRSATDALCSPLTMQWQADANSILILCSNTRLIEWHIYDEEQREYDHLKPLEMAVSQDGNFLLTSDHMGAISVWTFPRLSLIYQLVNENEFIEDLAFSPDSQRFYDLRGPICNVWEPDALIRPDEQELEDRGSSVVTEPVITRDESSQTQVTALAYGFGDKYFCAGREDGTVSIHDAENGKRMRKIPAHSSTSSVIKLSWSSSGKYIVSGDDSGRIVVKRVELKEDSTWAVFPALDFRVGEPVEQVLLNESEKLLLVSASSTDRVWDIKAKKESCCRHWGSKQGRRWIQHPFKRELLIWISPFGVHTYSWKGLAHTDPEQRLSVQTSPIRTTTSHGKVVYWVALTDNKRYIVYLSGSGHTEARLSSGLHLEFLSTSDLQAQHPHSLASDCMADLAAQIKRLIGTYHDTIVFLDHDSWLCTWSIDTGPDDVKRHFFLPRDWLNHNSLRMATLNAEGTFFCPKHGDVAIVRHGMRF